MSEEIVLVAKISRRQVRGMGDHCQRAAKGEAHFDGWTHAVDEATRERLRGQLRRRGYLWLLVQDGQAVRWQFRVTDALFLGADCGVCHIDQVHGDCYAFCTGLLYTDARETDKPVAKLHFSTDERLPKHDPKKRGRFWYAVAQKWMKNWKNER